MDSLLYVGAGDEDDEDDEDDEEEGGEDEPAPDKKAPAVDFAALERAGYKATRDLTTTETYQRIAQKEEEDHEQERLVKQREKEEAAAAAAAKAEAEEELLNRKKIDEKLGWEKRYDRTKEDFRSKEKRKRDMGQQSRDGNWVEEEKRILRHGTTGNYDS